MNRAEKAETVAAMTKAFEVAPHVFLADFQGLSVNQANALRRRVREAGGAYRVVKNRLARRAAAGTAAGKLVEGFRGPRAVVLHESDPAALAKVLNEFSRENPQLRLVAAVLEARDLLDAQGIKTLASLPGLSELRAQLLALIQTPATTLVRLLNVPGGQIARALDRRREKLESGPAEPAS